MMDRRQWIGTTLGAGAVLGFGPRFVSALAPDSLIERPIPSSGEKIPVIGLGSSATFRSAAESEDAAGLGDVLKAMVARGATVFDTAPSYGASEEVAGRLARELGLTDKLFWATKVNVARGGGPADPAAARAQIEESFRRFGVEAIDLIQVDNRSAEEKILPLAIERKIAVMVYAPFGRTRLFQRVGERPLPDWAAEFDAASWAQFFLKFVLGHPAVIVATPATSNAKHMVDNLGGGAGRVPDEAMRLRMAALVDELPADSG